MKDTCKQIVLMWLNQAKGMKEESLKENWLL